MPFSIAIDGPAGAGKSTIAKRLAAKLKCIYIDTGAMYRTVAYYCMQNNIDYTQEENLTEALKKIDISIKYSDDTQTILLNNENVTELIRTQNVAKIASIVATYTNVRKKLVDM
ncbi:MAG: (d)CMP kinase, partial [Cellulosilyticaceae bacterium]